MDYYLKCVLFGNLADQAVEATRPAFGVLVAQGGIAKAFVREAQVRPIAVWTKLQRHLGFMHFPARSVPRPRKAERMWRLHPAVLPADDVKLAVGVPHADPVLARHLRIDFGNGRCKI